jgi:hypothetical protein
VQLCAAKDSEFAVRKPRIKPINMLWVWHTFVLDRQKVVAQRWHNRVHGQLHPSRALGWVCGEGCQILEQ